MSSTIQTYDWYRKKIEISIIYYSFNPTSINSSNITISHFLYQMVAEPEYQNVHDVIFKDSSLKTISLMPRLIYILCWIVLYFIDILRISLLEILDLLGTEP